MKRRVWELADTLGFLPATLLLLSYVCNYTMLSVGSVLGFVTVPTERASVIH